MPNRRKREWIDLRDARDRLCVTFGRGYFTMFVDEALANAISIGKVPVYGVPRGKILRVPIEGGTIREPTGLDISRNELYLKSSVTSVRPALVDPDFSSVQIEWKALEAFVRENYVDHSGSPRRPGQATITAAFRESVLRHLAENTKPSREQHIAELRQDHPGIRDDQYDKAKKTLMEKGVVPRDWSKPGRPRKPLKQQ
jgi:hypothetical protein